MKDRKIYTKCKNKTIKRWNKKKYTKKKLTCCNDSFAGGWRWEPNFKRLLAKKLPKKLKELLPLLSCVCVPHPHNLQYHQHHLCYNCLQFLLPTPHLSLIISLCSCSHLLLTHLGTVSRSTMNRPADRSEGSSAMDTDKILFIYLFIYSLLNTTFLTWYAITLFICYCYY